MSAPQYSKVSLRISEWKRTLITLLLTHKSAPLSSTDQPHPTTLPQEGSSQSHVLNTTLNDLAAHESSNDLALRIASTSGPPLEISSDWVCSSKLYQFSVRTE